MAAKISAERRARLLELKERLKHDHKLRFEEIKAMAQASTIATFKAMRAHFYGSKKANAERLLMGHRFLFRPLSFPVASLFHRWGFSANQVSLIGLLGVFFGLIVLWARPEAPIWGALLLFLATVIDFADGIVARHNRSSSGVGAALDGCIDAVFSLSFAAAGLGLFTQSGNPHFFIWGAATTLAWLLWAFAKIRVAYGRVRDTQGHQTPISVPKGLKVLRWGFLNLLSANSALFLIAIVADVFLLYCQGVLALFLTLGALDIGLDFYVLAKSELEKLDP